MYFANPPVERVVDLLLAVIDDCVLMLGDATVAFLSLVRWSWYMVAGVGRLERECGTTSRRTMMSESVGESRSWRCWYACPRCLVDKHGAVVWQKWYVMRAFARRRAPSPWSPVCLLITTPVTSARTLLNRRWCCNCRRSFGWSFFVVEKRVDSHIWGAFYCRVDRLESSANGG